MASQTQQIVNNFVSHFNDVTEEVSLNDMKKILSDLYKKKGSKKSLPKDHTKPKKEPSQYNIFMKNEMQRLKESGSELNATERMRTIAGLWKSKNVGLPEESKEVVDDDKPKEEVKLPEETPDEDAKPVVEEPKKKKVVTKK